MAMEYLCVKFSEDRCVKIVARTGDWRTNATFEIEAGTYTVTLDPSDDIHPRVRTIELKNTSVIKPMEISFEKKSVSAGPV